MTPPQLHAVVCQLDAYVAHIRVQSEIRERLRFDRDNRLGCNARLEPGFDGFLCKWPSTFGIYYRLRPFQEVLTYWTA